MKAIHRRESKIITGSCLTNLLYWS